MGGIVVDPKEKLAHDQTHHKKKKCEKKNRSKTYKKKRFLRLKTSCTCNNSMYLYFINSNITHENNLFIDYC